MSVLSGTELYKLGKVCLCLVALSYINSASRTFLKPYVKFCSSFLHFSCNLSKILCRTFLKKIITQGQIRENRLNENCLTSERM